MKRKKHIVTKLISLCLVSAMFASLVPVNADVQISDKRIVSYDEHFEVKEVEEIFVTCYAGNLPSLPSYVRVTYADGTKGTEKAMWPTDLSISNFSAVGTKAVEGTIVGTDFKITAHITIVNEAQIAPSAVTEFFGLDEVTLDGTDTIYSQNAARAYEYLKLMDADRMLYDFRLTFGADTKGAAPLGGWDAPTGLLRGHSTGHYMSGLALAYASSGDETYKEKLDYMVSELRKIQKLSKGDPADFVTRCTSADGSQALWSTDPNVWGEGYISAYAPDQFAMIEKGIGPTWAPYYTLHKIFAGFLDSYTYTGNETGLEAAKALGLWIYNRLSVCTEAEIATMVRVEFGGINESLADLYLITGDERYLTAARFFDNTAFYDGLEVNSDTIKNRHANTHIPQIIGAITEYQCTDDVKYYNIAENFWNLSVNRYIYSTGGVGTDESYRTPYVQGNSIWGATYGNGRNCETCCAYNMLKLTMELYNYDPDNAEYMDYFERTLINHIVASQSHETTEYRHNGVTYMLPLDPGQIKTFDSDYGGFTCCNGTGMENHVKYQAAAYAHTDDCLYVNLYMPTTVTWDEKNVTVKQETAFPSEHSKLTVFGSGTFTMKLRVPYWATDGFTVKVNDEEICTEPEVSSYVEITRTWSDGDVVSIQMPYTVHLDKTPDKVDGSVVASLMYGPLVMAAKDEREKYIPMNWYKIALGNQLTESIEIAVGTDENKLPQLSTNGLEFYPMYDICNYAYHAYVKIFETDISITKEALEELVLTFETDSQYKQESILPSTYWRFWEALKEAKAVLAAEDVNQADIVDVYIELQNAIECIKPAGAFDPNALEKSAELAYSYCSSWENAEGVRDGKTGSASLAADCDSWGTWGNNSASEEWISYEWSQPVRITGSKVYFFDNSNGGDGGVLVPTSYRYEYRTADGRWTEFPIQTGLGREQDQYNVTTFGNGIETTGIRMTCVKVKKESNGVGINEWKITAEPASEKSVDSNIALYATASADYTNIYGGVVSVVNDGKLIGSGELGWNTWKNEADLSYPQYLSLKWDEMQSISYMNVMYWADNGTLTANDNVTFPKRCDVEYLNVETGQWTKITKMIDESGEEVSTVGVKFGAIRSDSDVAADYLNANNRYWNTVMFEEPIQTTELRLVFDRNGTVKNGVGVGEWEVFGKAVEAEPTPVPVELPYVDVKKTDWFYDAAEYTYVKKLMTGIDKEHFSPYDNLLRAQFAVMLYRMEETPDVDTDKTFKDITGDEWYGPAVLWAAENEIVAGYLNGSFGPADRTTREQMVVMMYRYANYLKEDTDIAANMDSFTDVKNVSPFAAEAMEWAVGRGIITGKENGTKLDPQGGATRAEAAVIIQKFLEK